MVKLCFLCVDFLAKFHEKKIQPLFLCDFNRKKGGGGQLHFLLFKTIIILCLYFDF